MIRMVVTIALATVLLGETQSSGSPPAWRDGSALALAGHGSTTVVAAKKRRRHRRPGCGKFCHQAGGFGPCAIRPDGTTVCTRPRHPVRIRTRRARVTRHRIVRIRATCRRNRACVGAIILRGHLEYGRADLRIGGHRTRRVRVGVSRRGLRYLRRHDRDRRVFALVFQNESDSFSSRRITLLPPRERED